MSERKELEKGKLVVVPNAERKFGASDQYVGTKITNEYGEEVYLLFTDYEIQKAKERAEKNPEDFNKTGWFFDIID